MSAPTGKKAPYPNRALPTETFFGKQTSMYLNGEGIQTISQPAARSDGDSIVFFRRSDVITAGGIIDFDTFPMIDLEKGGSIQGEIDALNHIIELAIPSTPLLARASGTYVVPGRGRILDQADVVEYRDMVVIIRDVVLDMIRRGMSLDQIQHASPAKRYTRRYGSESMFVEAIYRSLIARK